MGVTRLFVVCSLGLIFSTPVFAGKSTVKIQAKLQSVEHVFEDLDGSGMLQVTARPEKSEFKIEADSFLSSISKEVSPPETNRIPGKDFKGQEYISLEKKSGEVYLNYHYSMDDNVKGLRFRGGIHYRAPLEIVEGTWEDFQKGENAVFRPTSTGTRIIREEEENGLRLMVEPIYNSLAKQCPKVIFQISDLSLDRFEMTDLKVSGNLKRIALIRPSIEADFSFAVTQVESQIEFMKFYTEIMEKVTALEDKVKGFK